MSTPVPAAPPPPPNRAFRMPVRRRPAPSAPLEDAAAADGSRCVTRDPETSPPPRRPAPFRPAWPSRHPERGLPPGRRTFQPWPRDPRLRDLFDRLGIDRRPL